MALDTVQINLDRYSQILKTVAADLVELRL